MELVYRLDPVSIPHGLPRSKPAPTVQAISPGLSEHLEGMCLRLLDHCNASDYQNPWVLKVCDPNMIDKWGEHDDNVSHTFDAHVRTMLNLRKIHPQFKLRVISIIGDISERRGTAKMWATVRVSGAPVGVERESVSILSMRRTDRGWIFWKHTGMCQVAPFPL